MPITVNQIRIDGGPRRAGWDPDRYEQAVLSNIRRIQRTQSGWIVLSALRHRTAIVPFPPGAGVNADADVAPLRTNTGARVNPGIPDARYRHGYRANDHIYHCRTGVPTRNFLIGTGRGIDAEIRFTPGDWPQQGAAPGQSRDEVLVHELVHAVRVTRGIGDCRVFGAQHPLQGYDNRSEFFAVLVENVYSSETRRVPRRDHHGFRALPDPVRFYAQTANKLMIMDFCRDMPRFTRDLASVPCSFNAFREYYREMSGLTPSTVRATS